MERPDRDALRGWLAGLGGETRLTVYLLLEELCGGMDVSRHTDFGFFRLRAEFETSGEIFGCTLEELRDAVAATLSPAERTADRPRSALQALRRRVAAEGHPDFRGQDRGS